MSDNLRQMRSTLRGEGQVVDLTNAFSLARPLSFNDDVDGAFGLPAAVAKAVELGDFVGDTQRGGSVNCMTLVLHPHGDGTHIETAAHVVSGAPLLCDVDVEMCLAAVLLLQAVRFSDTSETYSKFADDDDWVLTRAELENAWAELEKEEGSFEVQAFVLGRSDDEENAYFTFEAMQFLQERSLRHLLVEEKSIDRLDDGGQLINHRIWFELAARGEHQTELAQKKKSLCEMIRTPRSFVKNKKTSQRGRLCLLSLPIPPWRTDAAPIVPSLFPFSSDS